MAGQVQVTGLPVSGSGLPIAGSSIMLAGAHGYMEVAILALGAFTLLLAAKTVRRMAPVRDGGEVRDRT